MKSRVALAILGLSCSLGQLSCKDGPQDPSSPCRIDYEIIDGEASARFDLVWVSPDQSVVTRTVHESGDAPTRAIYYYFDEAGELLVEAMDTDLDGTLDARLDAGELLGGLITPYSVDALIEDGNLDGVQLSMSLPSSMIGPWSPARVYYQVACDQGDFTTENIDLEQLNIGLDADDDGAVDGGMALQFGKDGLLQTWTIDGDGDGQTDHVATIDYDEEGRVAEVFWTQPEEFFGDVYILARYQYDAFGQLYAYEVDATGNGEFDHRITYSAGCFDYEGLR